MVSNEILATRNDLHRASHAAGEIYASKEIYRREVEVFFMRDWLYVGRVEELPNSGDYMTMRIADEPVIIARDKGGELAHSIICASIAALKLHTVPVMLILLNAPTTVGYTISMVSSPVLPI